MATNDNRAMVEAARAFVSENPVVQDMDSDDLMQSVIAFAALAVAAERTRICDELVAIDDEAVDAETLDILLTDYIDKLRGK